MRRRVGAVVAAAALAASGLTVLLSTAAPLAPANAEGSAQVGATSFGSVTYHAYVGAGEHLNVAWAPTNTTTTTGVNHRIVVTDPSGVVKYDCTAAGSNVCTSPDLTGATGAWKIEDTQGSGDGSGSGGTAWTINVSNGTAVQSGRVWTNSASLQQVGGQLEDFTFYLVNDAGYQYTVDLNQYNGIASTIAANSLGITDADCVPTYQSAEGDPVTGLPVAPFRQDCGPQYRVFFQQPSAALPATAPSSDGTLSVLPAPLSTADLAVDDLAFNSTTPTSAAGTFTYSISPRFSGSYALQIDTNGNGTYDDVVDRTITLGADGSGKYSYDFDGLNGQGNPVADCRLMHARIFFDKIGEMHVLQSDVEGRVGGISISRTNGPGAPDATVRWDDTNLANNRDNTTPVKDGTAGVDSSAGVHGWGFLNTRPGSWGNNRVIDDYSWLPVNLGTGEIAIGGRCLNVTKTADRSEVVPGQKITYTITATNTGDADFTADAPASLTDDMSAVIDDATYNNDASGGATYDQPTLSWSGPLAAGAAKTITYSVTVNDPDTGDQQLTNAVVSDSPGSNCPTAATDPDCRVEIPSGSYTVAKSASTTTALPGETVTYTVVVTNTGKVDYTAASPASFSDDLSKVTDDATYNGDATEGATVTGNKLSWSGALAAGATRTITYSVKVNNPDTGDKELTNAVAPTSPGGRCATDGGCTTTTVVPSYTTAKTASTATTTPGSKVTYTVTVTNTGKGAYTSAKPASLRDDLTDVLDDATYNKDASEGATIQGNTLTWSGPLAVGQTVKITYSVTVKDPDTGNKHLVNVVVPTAPGGGCDQPGSCKTDTPIGSYTVTKTVSTTDAVKPGTKVGYTITVKNTGPTAYTAAKPAKFDDDMSDVLDDATYNNDATQGATLRGTTLSWAGPLEVGQTITVTYSVTVKPAGSGNGALKNTVDPTVDGGTCDPSGSCVTGTPIIGTPPGASPTTPPGAAPTTPTGLAFTGTELVGPGIGLALMLLALGGGLMVIRRRRQHGDEVDNA